MDGCQRATHAYTAFSQGNFPSTLLFIHLIRYIGCSVYGLKIEYHTKMKRRLTEKVDSDTVSAFSGLNEQYLRMK